MRQDCQIVVDVTVDPTPVTRLRCRDPFVFDPAPLAALAAERGVTVAEETACRTLEDLAERLSALHHARTLGALSRIPVSADRISALAGQIGLIEVSAAASHVSRATLQADGVALEATLDRLERAFDSAAAQIWNFKDHF